MVPARLCSPAVVHHQLLGASGLPISLTQPQLRPDPNQEWKGKHEVARSSICALTPSAVKPPTPINDPACVINTDRITCLVHCGRMALQLRLFRGLKIGSGTRVPYGQLSLTPGEHACVINADRITCLVHCGQITFQLRLSRLASEVE